MSLWLASCSKPQLAIVSTMDAKIYLEAKMVQCGGVIDYDEKSPVHSRGVCWMMGEETPNVENDKFTSDGDGWGNFNSIIDDDLEYNQTYSYCAYAITEAGASYGEVKTFMLDGQETKPIVTTGNFTINTTYSTVKCQGNVIDGGVGTVNARGFCWSSTTPNPSLSDGTHSEDGNGEGDFSHWIPNVNTGTIYYYCAYATNEYGTTYGEVKNFSLCSLPTVTTTTAFVNSSQCSAQLGGNVSNDGGSAVTARGVCYSTTYSTPTIDNSTVTNNGTGTGSFTSQLDHLSQGTTYYYRAYATNSLGTSYGSTYSFKIESSGGGLSFEDFEGTYTLSAFNIDDSEWTTYTGVSIYQFYNETTSSYWVAVEGIVGGENYPFFTAIGEFSTTNQCIRLYGTWYLLDQTFYFTSAPDILYYAVYNPIYASGSSFTVLDGGSGYSNCSEAWLTMDDKGNLTYGPSSSPDNNNLYANGLVFYYYEDDTDELIGRFEAYKNITLTKTSKHVDAKVRKHAKHLLQAGVLTNIKTAENYINTLHHE